MAPALRDIQERAFVFACDIVRFCDYLEEASLVTRTLARQLLNAATAVGSNLEEASAGQSKPDFISKTAIALKEAREAHYWLRLIGVSRESLRPRVASLLSEAHQLIAILTAILKKARSNPHRG